MLACCLSALGDWSRSRKKRVADCNTEKCILCPASSSQVSIPYAPLKDIGFIGKNRKVMSSAKKSSDDGSVSASKKYDLGNTSAGATETSSPLKKKACPDAPTEQEQSEFFNSLSACTDAKTAVLALVPPHCDGYVPTSLASELPNVLSDLYQSI